MQFFTLLNLAEYQRKHFVVSLHNHFWNKYLVFCLHKINTATNLLRFRVGKSKNNQYNLLTINSPEINTARIRETSPKLNKFTISYANKILPQKYVLKLSGTVIDKCMNNTMRLELSGKWNTADKYWQYNSSDDNWRAVCGPTARPRHCRRTGAAAGQARGCAGGTPSRRVGQW